ncbi:phosphoglycerate mutase (2,3-diphosphoglycerate-independent) [bacterium]|nr:phosphoglycerate mutase (2,3-diphosphoglycerate-independent) [bacterium]|tara:strand:+ start:119 stop:1714 length:1596 start_codon:yes stop_codon:yes gene_type:complete
MVAQEDPQPLVVVILDGWGISMVEQGNAIRQAKTPIMDMFAASYPAISLLAASVEAGLPWGEVGNSETGHTNIGAGQVRYQPRPRIDQAITDGSFFSNAAFTGAINHVQQNRSDLHLIGLVGPGAVHAHSDHLFALLKLAANAKLQGRVYLHLFTDGRDTQAQSATEYMAEVEAKIKEYDIGRIASVSGRFYAMDRNQNWDRTKQAYDVLTGGPRQAGASGGSDAVVRAYKAGVHDEMITPTAITRGGGPIGDIGDNDAVIFFNWRPDRARQLTAAFVDTAFVGFERPQLHNLYFASMSSYARELNTAVAFAEPPIALPVAKIISDAGLRQLHVAESEKYAHVTYYLNGGREEPFPNEDHVLIPSPTVTNFAQTPAMSALGITAHLIEALNTKQYNVYFVNYANADMIGHTGNYEATVQACAFIDQQLGDLYEAVITNNGAMLITSDHGNAEELVNPKTGAVETDHTNNPVPLFLVAESLAHDRQRTAQEIAAIWSTPVGVLADVAPTILEILGLPQPPAMTGVSLMGNLN